MVAEHHCGAGQVLREASKALLRNALSFTRGLFAAGIAHHQQHQATLQRGAAGASHTRGADLATKTRTIGALAQPVETFAAGGESTLQVHERALRRVTLRLGGPGADPRLAAALGTAAEPAVALRIGIENVGTGRVAQEYGVIERLEHDAHVEPGEAGHTFALRFPQHEPPKPRQANM